MTTITKQTINLVLERSTFGNSRRASLGGINVQDADKSMLGLSKRLMRSPELTAICDLNHDVRQHLWDTLVPNPLYRAGVYVAPIDLVEQVEAYLQERKALWASLVEAFLAAYPAQAEAAAADLKQFYNPRDYPTIEAMRAKFSFTWRYVSEAEPTQLKQISKHFFDQAKADGARQVEAAVDEIRGFLREAFGEIVAHMADRLSDKVLGKRNVFRDTLCDRLNGFLETFNLRNVTDDAELQSQVEQMRALMAGVTPKALRDDGALRQAIAVRVGEIKSTLDGMVVTAADRALVLD